MGVIEIKEGNTIGVWFLQTSETSDWLCCLGYEEVEGKRELIISHRFRYERPTGEKRSWHYLIVGNRTEESAIEIVRTLAATMSEVSGYPLDENLVGNDFDAFWYRLMSKDWTHAEPITEEEAKERGLI